MNYDRTNTGLLARNDKGGNESRPDYRGSINVNGQEFWLSAWIKQGREGTKLEGQKYMSLSVQPKDVQPAYAPPAPVPAPAAAPRVIHDRAPVPPVPPAPRAKTGTGFDDMDDDVPF